MSKIGFSRRDLLKASSAAAAGVLVSPQAGRLMPPASMLSCWHSADSM